MTDWKPVSTSPGYIVSCTGDIVNSSTDHQLKPTKLKNGYCRVTLCDSEGQHQVLVHKVVATEFVPNPNGYLEINHIDGDKANNRASNLEWCDRSENMKHAYRIGLQKPIPSQIEESLEKAIEKRKRPVRNVETGQCYESIEECARIEGMKRSAVSMHVTGKNKHCRFEYND